MVIPENSDRVAKIFAKSINELVWFISHNLYRSIHPEVFYKKGVLRNFAKFTGKHLCQSLSFNKVAGLLLLLRLVWWKAVIYFSMHKNLFKRLSLYLFFFIRPFVSMPLSVSILNFVANDLVAFLFLESLRFISFPHNSFVWVSP